jgi:hypothetical protein
MTEQSGTASASDVESSLAVEEEDWLPEESKRRARQLPDYQRLSGNCESCQ